MIEVLHIYVNITYPKVHQISKHITFNQKKLAKKEKWMMNAETEFDLSTPFIEMYLSYDTQYEFIEALSE